jgi:hypothetical protein
LIKIHEPTRQLKFNQHAGMLSTDHHPQPDSVEHAMNIAMVSKNVKPSLLAGLILEIHIASANWLSKRTSPS